MTEFLIPFLVLGFWPDTGQVELPPAPVVTVYSIPGCNFCTHVKRDTKGDVRDRDWRFVTKLHRNHLKSVRDIAERIEPGKKEPNGYPVLIWKDKSGKEVYSAGWTGLARWLPSWNKSQGLPAGGQNTSPPQTGDAPAGVLVPEPATEPVPVTPREPK